MKNGSHQVRNCRGFVTDWVGKPKTRSEEVEDIMSKLLISMPAQLVSIVAVVLLLTAFDGVAQQAFDTSEDAAAALVSAVRGRDWKNMLIVLGPDGADIVSSGDKVADDAARQRFVAAYDAKHKIAMVGDEKAVMIIGEEDFPFPIPLVREKGKWQFDTAAGRDEILYRRVGRNELETIQSCLAYVDAQNEYAEKDRGSGVGVYAQQIISDPGSKNGLYWPTAEGEDPSPLGELMGDATSEGYRVGEGRTPYHGYYYKILTEQGAFAHGGAIDYVVHGKMIGGFALVAYPAEYGNSGVMTFVVNHEGTVFQKDLGWRTASIARQMTEYNPDETWKALERTEPVR